jgi:hypothetical protein
VTTYSSVDEIKAAQAGSAGSAADANALKVSQVAELDAKAAQGYVPAVADDGSFIRDAAGAIMYIEAAVIDASWGALSTIESIGAGGERIVHDVLLTTREIVEAGADAAQAAGTAAVSAGAAVAVTTFSVGMFMTAAIAVGALVWFTRK